MLISVACPFPRISTIMTLRKAGVGIISENIKWARKAKGLSQEELAVRLNVVRQTISKWENGLSVPDADILIQLAELLEVSVSQLLGIEPQEDAGQDLTQQLAQLNEQLAVYARKARLTQQANKKRGAILLLSFLSLAVSLGVNNEIVSLTLFGACILGAVIVFYRNLTLLTGTTATSAQLRAVRIVTIFNIVLIAALFVLIALHQNGVVTLSEERTKPLVIVCIVVVMLFFGFISPKLPFNRYTGLRLPWTVQNEETWNVAHKILGYLSLPLALLYLAVCLTAGNLIDLGIVTMCTLLLWIGIPGALSFIFFWKKVHGKL